MNLSLLKTISDQRLRGYLAEAGGNLDAALTLYERNTKLSESLYTPLQCLEICLRNTLNNQLVQTYGQDWMERGVPLLTQYARDQIAEARHELPDGSFDDLVAVLRFSFWVSLLGPSYDATLWRQSLHYGFRATAGLRRSIVQRRLNAIRRFRNRVAHHEPIASRHMACIRRSSRPSAGCVSTLKLGRSIIVGSTPYSETAEPWNGVARRTTPSLPKGRPLPRLIAQPGGRASYDKGGACAYIAARSDLHWPPRSP